jgi:hypothetical protein
MDNELIQQIALLLGVGLGSGFNVYLTMLILGLSGLTGNFVLPEQLEFLQNPLIIGLAGILYLTEFSIDKIPGLDSLWDSVHTFVRVPLGAVFGADIMAESGALVEALGAVSGGVLASSTHLVKSGTRALINTSPEPASNWTASVSEDVAVFGGLWAALNYPLVWIVVTVLIIILIIWLLPKIWRGIKFVFRKIKSFFTKS